MLKLKPFEDYIGNDPVINYVGLRADEQRQGYISRKSNITTVYPFREDGITKADVVRILEESGLGMPTYTQWGRTRSGCYFCFYQQKIEWVRLKQQYPELFERAKQYEYANMRTGEAFYWNGRESLSDLEQPERMAEIERQWTEARERARQHMQNRTLFHLFTEAEEEEEEREGCLICAI